MRCERAVRPPEVIKGYAQNNRPAHDIKPDGNPTYGAALD